MKLHDRNRTGSMTQSFQKDVKKLRKKKRKARKLAKRKNR